MITSMAEISISYSLISLTLLVFDVTTAAVVGKTLGF